MADKSTEKLQPTTTPNNDSKVTSGELPEAHAVVAFPALPILEGPLEDVLPERSQELASQNQPSKTGNSDDSKEIPKDKYTEAQLHKNFTVLMLAYEPDVRAREHMKYLRQYLTPEQEERGLKLLLEHNKEFEDLKAKRAAILNEAMDGDETQAKLRQNKIEIVDLSNKLRLLIFKEILTKEQKDLRAKHVAEAREAKRLEQEQKR